MLVSVPIQASIFKCDLQLGLGMACFALRDVHPRGSKCTTVMALWGLIPQW